MLSSFVDGRLASRSQPVARSSRAISWRSGGGVAGGGGARGLLASAAARAHPPVGRRGLLGVAAPPLHDGVQHVDVGDHGGRQPHRRGPHPPPVRFLSGLLARERVRRGTRTDSRSSSNDQQAVLVLRWLFDDTRMAQLARDNDIGLSTAYDHRDEAIAVLAARKPLPARGAAGRQGRRPHPCAAGRHADLHRPHLHSRPTRGWICGGRASTATPPATSRSSRPPTAGRCRPPPTCAPAASTTPPPPAPIPSCSPSSPPESTTGNSAWPTSATKARSTPSGSRSRRPPEVT